MATVHEIVEREGIRLTLNNLIRFLKENGQYDEWGEDWQMEIKVLEHLSAKHVWSYLAHKEEG